MKARRAEKLIFTSVTLVHCCAISTYLYLNSKIEGENALTTALFFVGMTAWLAFLALSICFKKRNPTIARLSLILFLVFLAIGFISTGPTD